MTAISTTPRFGLAAGSTRGLLGKIAAARDRRRDRGRGAIPLLANQEWVWLTVLVVVTLALFFVYLQPWHIPLKYLVPGTIFLIAFQIVPVVFTFGVSFTNFGDGHRGTKDDAITAIEAIVGPAGPGLGGVRPDDRDRGRRRDRDPRSSCSSTRPPRRSSWATPEGLQPCTDCTTSPTRQGHGRAGPDAAQSRPGRRALGGPRGAHRSRPTNGAIKAPGLSRAFEGDRDARPTTRPATASPTPRRATSAPPTTPDGIFVDAETGVALPQGWQVNVGLANFTRAFTDPAVSGPFLGILVWNFAFAIISVAHHLRRRPAGGDGPELAAAAGAAVLPDPDRAAVRDAVVRDAPGLARHVQPGLRADQQPDRPAVNWFGERLDGPVRRSCSSSSGWATRTCSWSAWARSSPSRRT